MKATFTGHSLSLLYDELYLGSSLCLENIDIFIGVFVGKDVTSFILNIEPFEVDDNGVENFDVKQRICWLGATSTLQPKVYCKCIYFTKQLGGFVHNILDLFRSQLNQRWNTRLH